MTVDLKPYDVAEHLDSEDEIRLYLEAAFEDGDPSVIALALGNVARARGMSRVAADAGLTRAGLYKAIGPNGNPTLDTLLKVTKALGVRLAIAA